MTTKAEPKRKSIDWGAGVGGQFAGEVLERWVGLRCRRLVETGEHSLKSG